jgi:hypothetical protein
VSSHQATRALPSSDLEFDEDFINELKEIPEAIKYAKKAFDWDKVEGSKTYRERVLRRARRERQRLLVSEGAE